MPQTRHLGLISRPHRTSAPRRPVRRRLASLFAAILIVAQLLITTVPVALAGASSDVWTVGGNGRGESG